VGQVEHPPKCTWSYRIFIGGWNEVRNRRVLLSLETGYVLLREWAEQMH
jgi:hypothetical protein